MSTRVALRVAPRASVSASASAAWRSAGALSRRAGALECRAVRCVSYGRIWKRRLARRAERPRLSRVTEQSQTDRAAAYMGRKLFARRLYATRTPSGVHMLDFTCSLASIASRGAGDTPLLQTALRV